MAGVAGFDSWRSTSYVNRKSGVEEMTVVVTAKAIEHETGIPKRDLVEIVESLWQDNSLDNIRRRLVELVNEIDPSAEGWVYVGEDYTNSL